MSQAQQYYDLIAEKYDQATFNAWTPPFRVGDMAAQLAHKDSDILDVGIGTGQSIERLYTEKLFHSIEGIDISENMLKICAEKFPDIILHHGDFAEYTDFHQKNYNIIICCGALEFINNIENFFQKCADLLAQDGHLVLTYEPLIVGHPIQKYPVSELPSKDVAGFMTYRHSPKTFRATVEKFGWKTIQDECFTAYSKQGHDIFYHLVHLQKNTI